MELRTYQKTALDKIRASFRAGNRAILLVSPTGSGKGVMLSQLIRDAVDRGSRVLFLVHRREILFQVSEYMDRHGIGHGIIMASEPYEYGHRVDLATVQTISRRMKTHNYEPAEVVIVDEAHHGTAKVYSEVIAAFRKSAVIGFTATPCRETGHGLGKLFDDLIMAASIQELTDAGYLVPIKYFAPSEPDLTGVKITAGDYNEKQLEKAMNKPKLVGDVVENWTRIGGDRQTVVFTTTVAHSLAVCEAFNAVGIPADHVDGRTDKDERADVLRRFRNGDVRVLCNCAVFTEGVDIPDIACVVMARPTKSLSLYMQTIGRGMRPANGKTDMIYIDHAGACYEHGPVHEITDWFLNETTKNGSKKNEKRKERNARPITCEMCSCVYTGQLKCPECRHIPDLKKLGKDVAFIDASLGEVCFHTKTAKVKAATKEERQRWYSELLGYAKERGFAEGWAWHKCRAKFGSAPRGYFSPRTPSPEVRAWIRGQAAMAAIAKSKGGAGA